MFGNIFHRFDPLPGLYANIPFTGTFSYDPDGFEILEQPAMGHAQIFPAHASMFVAAEHTSGPQIQDPGLMTKRER